MMRPYPTYLAVLLFLASSACGQSHPREPRAAEPEPHSQPIAAEEDGLIASPEPDWPQWRGPRRDGTTDEAGLLLEWPEGGPKLLWRIDGIGHGWSSPIIVGDSLYITGDIDDNLVVFAFDLAGAARWRTVNGLAWKGSYPGARATCAFSEGRIYHMNAHGRVACLDANTGAELWAVDVLERFQGKNITWALSECLLLDGPQVVVTPGGEKALMALLDTQTGRTVWTTPPIGDERTSHSSPILFRYAGRRMIANSSAAHGFGVDADTGELLWTVPLSNRFGTNVSTPVYHNGGIYYTTPYGELGRRYDLRLTQAGIEAEHVWTSPVEPVTGCAVLVGDTLFAAGYQKLKHWFAIDWQTGQTRHELEDFTTGAAIYAGERLYVLDQRGNVGLVDPRPDGLHVAGRFRLIEDRVNDAWAHPVLLNGRLYLRYHDSLWCYDVAADE